MVRFAAPAALALALAACTQQAEREAPVEQAATEEAAAVELIPAADLAAMMAAGEALVIDVRTPAEFAESRLAGALNAPLSTFDPASIPMMEDRETILYCGSSRRSGIAAEMLAEHKGGKVRHLEGGITAWKEAGLETQAEPEPEA